MLEICVTCLILLMHLKFTEVRSSLDSSDLSLKETSPRMSKDAF